MGEHKEEPIVFKVFYEGLAPSPNDQHIKEVRKLVFSNLPNFKQLYDRLVRIELEKQSAYRENVDSSSNLSPKNVRIEYIDEEGDRISIACNDDLQYLVEEKVCHCLDILIKTMYESRIYILSLSISKIRL